MASNLFLNVCFFVTPMLKSCVQNQLPGLTQNANRSDDSVQHNFSVGKPFQSHDKPNFKLRIPFFFA